MSVAERIARQLDALVTEGSALFELMDAKGQPTFVGQYQSWYTRALVAVRQLVPERLDDFQRQYSTKRKTLPSFGSYLLEDYMHGIVVTKDFFGTPAFDIHAAAQYKFHTQFRIVVAAKERLSDILANIRGLLQADLFDSELEAARHLMKNGHLRAAGAVAGVVLEGHLKETAAKHEVAVKVPRGKKPRLTAYNDALRDAQIYDLAKWRRIQWLCDIRNLCDHKDDRDPEPDEVSKLIDGTDEIIKTVS